MDGNVEGGKQQILSEGVTLVYADNTSSIIHGVERYGDDDV